MTKDLKDYLDNLYMKIWVLAVCGMVMTIWAVVVITGTLKRTIIDADKCNCSQIELTHKKE